MTTTLQITDGSTLVDLNGANGTGTGAFSNYVPKPKANATDASISETARVRFRDTSTANVLTEVRVLELLLQQAQVYATTRRGAPVYVAFKPEGSETQYRSKVLSGELDYDKNTLSYKWQVKNAPVLLVDVAWTRVPYWEADTEIQVPLLNSTVGVTKTTCPLSLLNHEDSSAGHDNYAEIAAADVIGTEPAAGRIEITNTYAAAAAFTYYLAHGAYADVGTLTHVLEGESATIVSGSVLTDATCSGTGGAGSAGQYAAITGITAAEVRAAVWAISASQAIAMQGQFFRVFARFQALPASGMTTRIGTYLASNTTLLYASDPKVLSTSQSLQELGYIQLPPWLKSLPNSAAFDLSLNAKSVSGSGTLNLDYIMLLPCDSFRWLSSVALGAANTDTVKDDGVIPDLWQETSASARTGRWVGYGEPLMLVPNRKQRIYLLTSGSAGTSEIARTDTVKLFYRPRKQTL